MNRIYFAIPVAFVVLVFFAVLPHGLIGAGWVPEGIRAPLKPYLKGIEAILRPARVEASKIFDIVHAPYWLKKSKLPVYRLEISENNIEQLISSLPYNPKTYYYDKLLAEDKIYVNADLSTSDGYSARVKVRYRGLTPGNWDGKQKALRIKFPKDNFYSGMSALNLFLPYDRAYFGEMLDTYRAKKLGLLSPDFRFVKVVINGKDYGVYLAAEPWSKEFLARNGTIDTNNIFSNIDTSSTTKESFFSKNKLGEWKSYTAENELGPFEELTALITLLEDGDDREFAKKIGDLFDMDKFYKWQMINALAGSSHPSDTSNMVLLFRKETGKFELLPWDVSVYEIPSDFYTKVPTLTKRIFANKKFLHEYQVVVDSYTSDPKNLSDDIKYYDSLYKQYRHEFYKDQAKVDPDYLFDRRVKEYREFTVKNFTTTREMTNALKSLDFSGASGDGTVVFEGSFKYFDDIYFTDDQFLARHPQFYSIRKNTIGISSGDHEFYGISIVPHGLQVLIDPGARLLFAPGASLISYSPVTAIGSTAPIIMQSLRPGQATWGSFGVVNTGNGKNRFSNIHVSGGGDGGVINGVPFISQFSLHNTISEIAYSTFRQSNSDDALHAIGGSVAITNSRFLDAFADGIDFDFIHDALLADNVFLNKKYGSGGDGIDLSGARNIEIKNNNITHFDDKCISIGESSQDVKIIGNTLSQCSIGVAVKDNSHAIIQKNKISDQSGSGVSLYRKKQEFIKGGITEMIDNIFSGNKQNLIQDEFSLSF